MVAGHYWILDACHTTGKKKIKTKINKNCGNHHSTTK